MAHYLVHAVPQRARLAALGKLVQEQALVGLEPFGQTLHRSLLDARVAVDGRAVWEEEDYCSPPLAQEREAVLDVHFEGIEVEPVPPGEGWARIMGLPRLFPAIT